MSWWDSKFKTFLLSLCGSTYHCTGLLLRYIFPVAGTLSSQKTNTALLQVTDTSPWHSPPPWLSGKVSAALGGWCNQTGGHSFDVTHSPSIPILGLPRHCGDNLRVKLVVDGCLLAWHPSNKRVYLRDGSAKTIVLAVTLRQKLQIKLANSPSHSKLMPHQPVPTLTLQCQAPGRVATGVPTLKSPVWLNVEKEPRKRESNPGVPLSRRCCLLVA